jgi:amino acid transporter
VSSPSPATLKRALGRWDLTAIGINQVIGVAIFLIPSQLVALIGNWSPIAFVLAGLASLAVALSFAEVGSRFEGTGGPYLYTQAAFGRFVAFEVGWMQWFTRAASQASVANGIALALAFYWPGIETGAGRALLVTALVVTLAWVNARGITQSAWLVNSLTIAKLLPLLAFIAVGLFYADLRRLAPLPELSLEGAAAAGLLLIFTYGGYDVIGVPGGEASDPRRHLPFAFVATILIVTGIMTVAQAIAMTTHADLGSSTTPLADAALTFMGPAGAALIGVGSVISMTGNNAGQVLTGSRMLYALAENRALPRFFGYVHPVYRTPSNAIWFSSMAALLLALSGSFVYLATVSAVARLVTYTGTCGATLVLRQRSFEGKVQPATFTAPLGPVVPAAAILISVALIAGATRQQLLGGGAALAAGAVLYHLGRADRASANPRGADLVLGEREANEGHRFQKRRDVVDSEP